MHGFDPNRPLIASSGFTAGDKQIAAGSVFDWRAHGIPVIDAFSMFRSGLLYHATLIAQPPAPPVDVEAPAPERKRRARS